MSVKERGQSLAEDITTWETEVRMKVAIPLFELLSLSKA